jgi:hypothetical protein
VLPVTTDQGELTARRLVIIHRRHRVGFEQYRQAQFVRLDA